MNYSRARQIADTYDRIENDDPDISTERLLAMTSMECDCDDSDVIEALEICDRSQD